MPRVAAKKTSFLDAMRAMNEARESSLFGAGAGSAGGAGGESGGNAGGGRREQPSESVSQLAERIKGALEGLGSTVRVRGEISNFSQRNHWYFSLKDENAVIGCAMWQSDVARQLRAANGWMPKEGEAVVATGSVSFWAPQGRTQLYVRSLERVGMGTLQERFEALCRELREAGAFDEGRKRPLPAFPRRIAIVTSAKGAALQDCLRTAKNRLPAIELVLVDVRVQGEGAAEEVARAVRALDRASGRLGIEAIVVTRGGGSIEDLWAFNERVVAEAILARRNVPVVAAIGHESDTTIAELVADRRASTPTQAITLLVPDREELGEQLDQMGDRLASGAKRLLRSRRDLLQAVARHPFLRSPLAPVHAARESLGGLRTSLDRAIAWRVDRERQRQGHLATQIVGLQPATRLRIAADALLQRRRRLTLALERTVRSARDGLLARERQLEALGPSQVLARGFSYTLTEEGKVLRSVDEARSGMHLTTVVADGSVRSVVADRSGRTASHRSASGPPAGESSLFR